MKKATKAQKTILSKMADGATLVSGYGTVRLNGKSVPRPTFDAIKDARWIEVSARSENGTQGYWTLTQDGRVQL